MTMLFFSVLLAYLIGSLSSAIIVCRFFRLPDPRTQGSGNPGATNALRIGGKKVALLVFLGDFLKGLLPVLLACYIIHTQLYNNNIISLIALAVILGHIYPVFFKFKGGKGVATAAGVLWGLSWPAALAVMLTWFIMAIFTRYSSLAAIIAALSAPLYIYFIAPGHTGLLIFISAIILYKHYANIKNLLAKKEPKIKF